MKAAVLIRVGIDQSLGNWNAPCNPENYDFVYVPVPSGDRVNENQTDEDPSLAGYYANEIFQDIQRFSVRNNNPRSLENYRKRLGRGLAQQSVHLDPDFAACRLTYGNTDNDKGKTLKEFCRGDGERFVIFYSSMNPIRAVNTGNLEYGIIGIIKVQAVEHVRDITDEAAIEKNIHTRRCPSEATDVVVFGEQEGSGRLKKYLPIGKQRGNNHYYLKPRLLDRWGGLCSKDGTQTKGSIQRSTPVVTPCNQASFFDWWEQQNPEIIAQNNLDEF